MSEPTPPTRDWSQEFNALPEHIRIIGAAMEVRTRIQHLNFEKDRLKRRYDQSMREINEHILNCEKWFHNLNTQNPKT
jgi:hypothetical protein